MSNLRRSSSPALAMSNRTVPQSSCTCRCEIAQRTGSYFSQCRSPLSVVMSSEMCIGGGLHSHRSYIAELLCTTTMHAMGGTEVMAPLRALPAECMSLAKNTFGCCVGSGHSDKLQKLSIRLSQGWRGTCELTQHYTSLHDWSSQTGTSLVCGDQE
jgi:hypothetical protein